MSALTYDDSQRDPYSCYGNCLYVHICLLSSRVIKNDEEDATCTEINQVKNVKDKNRFAKNKKIITSYTM